MMHIGGFTIELTVSTERGAGGRRIAVLDGAVAQVVPPIYGPARSRRQRISRGRRHMAVGSARLSTALDTA